jgi:hypothetical protein
MSVKVADEVWIATALLHREQPGREAFSASEIVDRAFRERLTPQLRPGVQVHAAMHCVANKRPNPGNHRMLYATPDGQRRLVRVGDDYHPYREGGRLTPREHELPEEYRGLLDWFRTEYFNRPVESRAVPAESAVLREGDLV